MYTTPITLGYRVLTTDGAEMIEELLERSPDPPTNRAMRLLTETALRLRIRAGDFARAKAIVDEKLAGLTELLGADHWYLEVYRQVLADCLVAEGKYEEAQPILEHCLATYEQSAAPNAWEAAELRTSLARLHEAAGRPELAAPYRRAVVDFALELAGIYYWPIVKSFLAPAYADVAKAMDAFDSMVFRCARDGVPLGARSDELTDLAQRILDARRRVCPDEDPVAMLIAGQLAERADLLYDAGGLGPAAEALALEAHRIGGFHRDVQPAVRIPAATLLYAQLVASGKEGLAREVGREVDMLVLEDLPEPRGWARDETAACNDVVWSIARTPGLAPATYAAAARLATEVLATAADRANASNTIGVSLYRAGRYEEAIEHLAESERLLGATAGDSRAAPANAAFLAMAHHRLGHGAEAAARMEQLREIMRAKGVAAGTEDRAFLAEAEAVLAGDR